MCTTLTRKLCAFTVTSNVEFQNNSGLGAGAFAAMVNGWDTAIEDMWRGPDGHQHFECCTVEFTVVTAIGAGTAGFHQIDVVAGPQTSFVNALGPGCTGGRWDALDNGNVVAHESGHLLGVADEYDYNGPGGTYRNLNPQPAGQPQSIMAQTWGNVAALQSHIDTIMNGLNADCPWWCCLCWPLHRLTDLIRRILPLPLLIRAGLPSIDEVSTVTVQPSDDALKDVLELARDGRPSSLMDAIRVLDEAGPKAREVISEAVRDEHVLVRWVGIVAADGVGDEDALATGMDDDDLRVRVAAASGLARRGQRDGIPALLEGLTSNQVAIGHPPELLADVAEQALVGLAGESVSADTDSPEARAERWRRWSETSD